MTRRDIDYGKAGSQGLPGLAFPELAFPEVAFPLQAGLSSFTIEDMWLVERARLPHLPGRVDLRDVDLESLPVAWMKYTGVLSTPGSAMWNLSHALSFRHSARLLLLIDRYGSSGSWFRDSPWSTPAKKAPAKITSGFAQLSATRRTSTPCKPYA